MCLDKVEGEYLQIVVSQGKNPHLEVPAFCAALGTSEELGSQDFQGEILASAGAWTEPGRCDTSLNGFGEELHASRFL